MCSDNSNNQDGIQSGVDPLELPDLASCRGDHIADGLVACLVKTAANCPYALRFGYGYFCQHPQRLKIAAHSKTGGSVRNISHTH